MTSGALLMSITSPTVSESDSSHAASSTMGTLSPGELSVIIPSLVHVHLVHPEVVCFPVAQFHMLDLFVEPRSWQMWGNVNLYASGMLQNEEAHIESAIQSVNIPGVEVQPQIIVVDAGSADETCSIATRQPGVKVLQVAGGRGAQLNEGVRPEPPENSRKLNLVAQHIHSAELGR